MYKWDIFYCGAPVCCKAIVFWGGTLSGRSCGPFSWGATLYKVMEEREKIRSVRKINTYITKHKRKKKQCILKEIPKFLAEMHFIKTDSITVKEKINVFRHCKSWLNCPWKEVLMLPLPFPLSPTVPCRLNSHSDAWLCSSGHTDCALVSINKTLCNNKILT